MLRNHALLGIHRVGCSRLMLQLMEAIRLWLPSLLDTRFPRFNGTLLLCIWSISISGMILSLAARQALPFTPLKPGNRSLHPLMGPLILRSSAYTTGCLVVPPKHRGRVQREARE